MLALASLHVNYGENVSFASDAHQKAAFHLFELTEAIAKSNDHGLQWEKARDNFVSAFENLA